MIAMNKFTLKSALFFILFGIAFTSCTKDEDNQIPTLTVSGANPFTLDTINTPYVEPGVSTDEGTLVYDQSAFYNNKRGEYTIYYSAIDDADNIGHATRRVIVRNPADVLEGTYEVEVYDIGTGAFVDYYTDVISVDDYVNGKFYFSFYDASCGASTDLNGKFDWSNNTVYIPEQTYNNQQVLTAVGTTFPVSLNGSDVNFEMDVIIGSTTRKYIYRKQVISTDETKVLFVHTYPDGATLDVFVDNEKRETALAFGDNSSYYTIEAGTHGIKYYTTGTCDVVHNHITNLSANTHNTLYLVDNQPNVHVFQVQDDLSDPTSGMARVRFVHAAANTGPLDINVNGGSNWFSGITFENFVSTEVTPGTYTLDMVEGGNIIANSLIILEANKVYTLYSAKNSSGSQLGFIINK